MRGSGGSPPSCAPTGCPGSGAGGTGRGLRAGSLGWMCLVPGNDALPALESSRPSWLGIWPPPWGELSGRRAEILQLQQPLTAQVRTCRYRPHGTGDPFAHSQWNTMSRAVEGGSGGRCRGPASWAARGPVSLRAEARDHPETLQRPDGERLPTKVSKRRDRKWGSVEVGLSGCF